MSILIELLKRPIAYHPIIAKAFGSTNLAIMWSQFFYWSTRTRNEEGWIHKTREEVFEETGLTRREQETARKIGNKLGVLESIRMGHPCTVHFRVNLEKTEELIRQYTGDTEEKQPVSYIEYMIGSNERPIHIIGIFAREKGIAIPTKTIYESLKKRHYKPASLLEGYSDEKIIKTIKKLEKLEYIKKFTLETVLKYIDEKEERRIIGFKDISKEGTIYKQPIYEKV